MAKLTKAQRNRLHDLQMTVFATSDKIFSVVERSDVPFLACYAAAPVELRLAHDKARQGLESFTREMTAQGRGYINAFGHFEGNN